jgi:hypothetical protein
MASTNNQCAVCSKPGKLCASCEDIHYCSPECQKTDWKVHKLLCRTFKAFCDPPVMMRVIAFPVNSIKPEFRWMPIKKGTIQRPIVDKFFGDDDPFYGYVSFALDPSTGNQLPLRLTIQSRDDFRRDGSLPNKALIQLTEGSLRQPFAGPVLVYGNALDNNDGNSIHSVNLDTTHLNVIKSWFVHGFYTHPNDKLYRHRFEKDTEWHNSGTSKEAADELTKDILARGDTVPRFHLEDLSTPEFYLWHSQVGRYKKQWMAKRRKEDIASGEEVAGEVPEQTSEEEEAWRSEMRVSGRMWRLDVVLP